DKLGPAANGGTRPQVGPGHQRQAHSQSQYPGYLATDDEDAQCSTVADKIHAARDTARPEQIQRIEQQAADCPEGAGSWAGNAIVEPQSQAMGPLAVLTNGHVFVTWRRGWIDQQIKSTDEHDQRQQLVEPACRNQVRQPGTERRAD